MRTLCAASPTCHFVDTWQLFKQAGDSADNRHFRADHAHLSTPGYLAWAATLKDALTSEEMQRHGS